MSEKSKVTSLEEQASDSFVQHLQGDCWTPADQAVLEARLESDPAYASAYRRVEESWGALGRHAQSPEVMGYREEAIGLARRAGARRWLKPPLRGANRWWMVATAAVAIVALAVVVRMWSGDEYHTAVGEQRIVELADHSRIALDAQTQLRVRYSQEARIIELKKGQAEFSVGADSHRPFKVIAGDRTIVVLGTTFTVEYTNRKIHVATLEGKVAVIPDDSKEVRANSPSVEMKNKAIELSAGEELKVNDSGQAAVNPAADLEAATAWRRGKIIIRSESLQEAAERMNRYSKLKIRVVGERLAGKHIGGVFEMGDTRGFLQAVERYLPVTIDYSNDETVRISDSH